MILYSQISPIYVSLLTALNPYAAGGLFGQYKKMQKNVKLLKPWQMGTHLRVLGESFQMNTKTTGFRCFFQESCILLLLTKVVSALEGLTCKHIDNIQKTIEKVIGEIMNAEINTATLRHNATLKH